MVVVEQGFAVAGEGLQITLEVAVDGEIPFGEQRAARVFMQQRAARCYRQGVFARVPARLQVAAPQIVGDIGVVVEQAAAAEYLPGAPNQLKVAVFEARRADEPVPAARLRQAAPVRLVVEAERQQAQAQAAAQMQVAAENGENFRFVDRVAEGR